MPIIELYGYFGSSLIAVSLMMSNIIPLRWINLVGAGMFASYGVIIQAWPVAALNGFIVLIDIYHLIKIYRQSVDEHVTRLPVDSPYVTDVLVRKWPQLAEVANDSELEVTFREQEPFRFQVV
ncbi:hypothetical protein [Reinekea blandensis]|uniref:YgjV family protein n=1 Tax=Reinekea blandensis MED297 TaxID=314283 RepID=A4BGD1_9GAMM|nr:hypothetical protein [Reinekea blandensis]EAR08926.1 hypothetical protein MED297_04632 [Reinekea sp. MED297] [Reinekea blandensis MED297]